MNNNDYFNKLKVHNNNHDRLHQRITRKIKFKSMKKNIIIVTAAIIGSALFARFLGQWMSLSL